jgi:hypothetical protein
MKLFCALSVATLTACFLHHEPKVPAAYQGDIPLVLANHSSVGICGFSLVDQTNDVQDWMNKASLDPHEQLSFRVKPGTYMVVVTSCDQEHAGIVKDYQLSRPTYVTYGNGETTPPADFEVVKVAFGVVGGAPQAPAPEEAAPAEEPPPDDCFADGQVENDPSNRKKCCSPLSHRENGLTICGGS